jgi:hypothetical protein
VAGFCEVENRGVLEDLVHKTPLKKFGYRIVHFDSPDSRGIDVALIYRPSLFQPDTALPIPVTFPFDPLDDTRDILYVRGILGHAETIHLFVNHWPSRYGGYEATRPKRNHAAVILRSAIDSILLLNRDASILAMGDFNDGPFDESLNKYLGAITDSLPVTSSVLVNLTAPYGRGHATGTLKYRENWDVFDQIIVSAGLLNGEKGLYAAQEGAQIHRPEFLLMDDEAYLGKKPFRTFEGMKYTGGYSDHLPVFIDLKISKPD